MFRDWVLNSFGVTKVDTNGKKYFPFAKHSFYM